MVQFGIELRASSVPASGPAAERPDVRYKVAQKLTHAGLPMLYMIIEDFHNCDPVPVYRRLRDKGRQMPDGLTYRGSWATTDLKR